MTRAMLLYLLLVLLPSGALGYFAFRAADAEHERRARALDRDVAVSADRLAGIAAETLNAARRRLFEDPAAAVGYARGGQWLGLTPPEGTGPATPGTSRLIELCSRGGQSFEIERRDPALAFDAYTFYLARIPADPPRARLQLAAARSARKAGDEALARALLGELAAKPLWVRTEEDVPVAVAARLLLGEDQDSAALGALLERERNLRALTAAVATRPEILSSKTTVLCGDLLLAARELESVREVRALAVGLPADSSGETSLQGAPPDPAPGVASVPVLLAAGEPPVAHAVAVDPHHAEKLAQADRDRLVLRGLVGLLSAFTLAGGAVLVLYWSRERRLAGLRRRLLANVSHELKTPVTAIRIFSELLTEEGIDAPAVKRYGEHLSAEGQRLGQIVENMLDVTRPGAAAMDLPREPVLLRPLLAQLAERFAFRAREKNVSFVTALAGVAGGDDEVMTNAPAVERIVLNLLDNALKYRRRDEPGIQLGLEVNGHLAHIRITDNGPGIPRGEEERIFEELYRVSYEDYQVQGSGLGLTIARRLARGLGGDVTVESAPGKGSTFILTLPGGSEKDHDATPAPR